MAHRLSLALAEGPAAAADPRPGRRQREAEPPAVLHLCHNDRRGGGSLAAYRLHRALLEAGGRSRMLVLRRFQDDPTVASILPQAAQRTGDHAARIADRLPLRSYGRRDRSVIWSPGWFGLAGTRHAWLREADVLSLYWINGGFLSIAAIGRLLRMGKPVVWRLSDMWPLTGGCHHAQHCRRYEMRCGRCPQLGSARAADLSARQLRAKTRWPTRNLVVVSPSLWLASLARQSAVLRGSRIEHIPTGIDLEVFQPRPRGEARAWLGLPHDRTLILFGGNQATVNPRKGLGHLLDALRRLGAAGNAGKLELVLFGSSRPLTQPCPVPVRDLGVLHDEARKAALFAACDLFAAPSLEENLPNTVIEAMACGTPTVAFDVGGTAELVEPHRTGYLARAEDAADLGHGIEAMLGLAHTDPELVARLRRRAVQRHDARAIAARYLELYVELHAAARRA